MNRICLLSAFIVLTTILPLFPSSAQAADLKAQTVGAWQHYVALTEARIGKELADANGFLVTEFISQEDASECRKEVAEGGVCVKDLESRNSRDKKVKVPKGTISHWLGSVRIPNAELDTLMAFVQRYGIHEQYFDDVEQSRLIASDGDEFKFFYRLKQSTLWVTVHYNTIHEVSYRQHSAQRISSASRTTRINEIDKPGKDEEREKPEGNDNGFMWRLNSYWRFQQEEDGVVVTLESLTLSRGIPWGTSLLVKPIVRSISRGLLENTLLALRDGYHAYSQDTAKAGAEPGKTSPEVP